MDEATILNGLKQYFGHSRFRSETQEKAIKTIIKRKLLCTVGETYCLFSSHMNWSIKVLSDFDILAMRGVKDSLREIYVIVPTRST